MNSRLAAFYEAHPEMAPRDPIPDVRAAADRWAGASFTGDWSSIQATRGPEIARWYEGAPMSDPAARPSFEAMANETRRQFDFLTSPKGLGIDVSVSDTDPYANPAEMSADIERGKMKVLGTAVTGAHDYFDNDTNDMFRAVHDVFGHAGTGRGFDRHGEEAAWLSHSRMYTPAARPAMTAETRGQNSALNYGSNPGVFAPQKIITAPAAFSGIGRRGAQLAGVLGKQWGV